MAGNFESSSNSDVLMIDPYLDYINATLMEEGMDDASFMQQVDNPSYQTIVSGFYEILGEHAPPNSYGNSKGVFDPHLLHQSMYCCHQNGPHVKIASPNVGLIAELPNTVGAPRVSLPANGHPQSSFQQETKNGRVEDAVVKGLRGHTGQEQGNGKLKLPSTDEFLLKLAEVDLSFEDLKLDNVYTSLYAEEPSSPAGAATDSKQKKKSLAGKGRKFWEKRASEVPFFVDVREVLVSCAQAVAIGDARRANEILQELQQVHGASANGTGLQRTAHFFSKALAARMRGMAEHEYGAMSINFPSAGMVLRASKFGFEVSPFEKILHYFANQSILKAAEGTSRLHIVDYGLMYGMQWPCLINALAERKGGPPLLVITGIAFPHPWVNIAERLDLSGQRLAAYAKTLSVPFQYHAIVTNKWEDLDAAPLHCHEGEVLVVNCKGLRHLADESVDLASTISPRQKFLTCMHNLNPHLLVTTVVSAAHNSPFFVSRFREALYFFSNVLDMLETLWGDSPQRPIVERSCFYRDIVNIVACEGAARVDRPETYKQWHVRITKVGFEQLPIPSTILSRSKSHVKQHYHKDFLILDDANGWLLMGWKGRTTLAASAWKPCLV